MDLDAKLAETVIKRFRTRFGELGDLQLAMAPGRINLIGEHTDYNDGWALPMAIDRYLAVAFRVRDNRLIRAHSIEFGDTEALSLDTLEPSGAHSWISYVAGTAWAMKKLGFDIRGIDAVIGGNVPLGAGLSSSAALEMSTARALCQASGITWAPETMARAGQQAEMHYVGVSCGPMDQLTSAAAQEGNALLLDCRSLGTEPVAIPKEATVVVMDSGARRSLAGSAYNKRRASCERAVKALQEVEPTIRALRDVDLECLISSRHRMDELAYRRASHVISENQRPGLMASALRDGALADAGELMNDSHVSLRDLYEVSSPELDRVTEIAREHPACFGARLTGAGFGGCGVALVDTDGAEAFVEEAHRYYAKEVDLPSRFFACNPVAGARLYPMKE